MVGVAMDDDDRAVVVLVRRRTAIMIRELDILSNLRLLHLLVR